ncbi:MAG: T9SS type A sorting domain-containing protein [Calditrichaeota bacterium]|jgi:hypothetical protein|nr:T9SS type A sorting domain-containing protein [Calditrichota bacterium]MBT7618548.1 T9SS type A sorting domain-containing protein [Calditrichota bacterium]MBT7787822.1 T9SS type A sorting domain-containing protein [Calditrichota bacterium]
MSFYPQHKARTCIIFAFIVFSVFAPRFDSRAQEALNIELSHRSACPGNLINTEPFLFGAHPGTILYGDETKIERLVEDNSDGFQATGMFVCQPDERLLALECNEEVAIIGFENGLGVLSSNEPAPRLIQLIQDDRTHQQVQLNENIVLTYSCPIGEENPDRIGLYELNEDNNLILRSTIDGQFARFSLGDNKLVIGNEEIGLILYDLSDIENPQRSSVLFEYVPYFLTWCGDILASGDLIRNELGVKLTDCNDPEDPVENATIEENDHAYVLSGAPGLLAVSHLRWDNVVLYNVEDPDDPVEIRSINTNEVGWSRMGGNSIRIFEEDIYVRSGNLPDAIFHLIPEGEDALTVVNRYYPPFGAEQIIKRDDNLIIRDRYKTAPFSFDQNGIPRSPHPAYHANHGTRGFNVYSCTGTNWIAISQSWMGQWVTVFTVAEDGSLVRQWEQNLGNPGDAGILEINNHLAIESGEIWQIMGIDGDGNVELVGDTDQPLTADGAFREGVLYCAGNGMFRIFIIGDEVDQIDLISEIEIRGERVYLHENAAYVPVPDGLEIIDISDIEAPEPVQTFQLEHGARRMDFENNRAVVSLVNSIVLLDLSEPFEPEITGWYNMDIDLENDENQIGFEGVAILNNTIFAGCRPAGPNGLFSFEISDDNARQIIQCREGWSIVSSYINPFEPNVDDIFNQANLRSMLQLCKNANGDFYVPQFGHNGIGNWDVSQAYWVDMLEEFSFEMIGIPVDPETEIPLQAGWSGVSYYPRVETEAEIAFGSIVEFLSMAKDQNGNFYYPALEFSNMETLRPGLGYQVHVIEDVGLIWSWENGERIAATCNSKSTPGNFEFRSRTGANMSLLVENQYGITGEIGVFAGDLCVGAGVLDGQKYCGIAIWGDDQASSQIDGAILDCELELVLLDSEWQPSNVDFSIDVGDLIYRSDDFLKVSIDPKNDYPETINLVSSFPNPFNNNLRITFELTKASKITATVYDISGREVNSILDNTLSTGQHNCVWNAKNASTGIYFVKLQSGQDEFFIKAALIK